MQQLTKKLLLYLAAPKKNEQVAPSVLVLA